MFLLWLVGYGLCFESLWCVIMVMVWAGALDVSVVSDAFRVIVFGLGLCCLWVCRVGMVDQVCILLLVCCLLRLVPVIVGLCGLGLGW